MTTEDGRFTIVFNGEIYNHEELREPLAKRGVLLRGRSDTEVLLKLFAELGPQCLALLDGMFAFAVFDALERRLFCARDHLGEKPLYYVSTSEVFAFASEVRALVAAGVDSATPSLEGLRYLFTQGSIPPPFTHLAGVHFLEPGSWLQLCVADGQLVRKRYWIPPFLDERIALQNRDFAVELVHTTLRRSVRRRLRADVPVGAFLSGGVDSSLVVALMQEQGAADLRTFTVTLPGQPGDEAALAKKTAQLLGTQHTEIPLELGADSDWLDEALLDMDVPSIDGPNTWLVSRAVRRAGATVACSGLGGDELFYGYPSFSFVPTVAAYQMKGIARCLSEELRAWLAHLLPPMHKVSRLAESILSGASVAALWYAKRSVMSDREVRELLAEGIRGGQHWGSIRRIESLGCPAGLALRRQVSFYELMVYMHDQLLRDTDQMSMAHALEIRVPLIGREVVETIAGIGDKALFGNVSKGILREILYHYLPRNHFGPGKQGFTLNWRELLRVRRQSELGPIDSLIRTPQVNKLWDDFHAGKSSFAPYFAVEAARQCCSPSTHREVS